MGDRSVHQGQIEQMEWLQLLIYSTETPAWNYEPPSLQIGAHKWKAEQFATRTREVKCAPCSQRETLVCSPEELLDKQEEIVRQFRTLRKSVTICENVALLVRVTRVTIHAYRRCPVIEFNT